MSAGKIRVLVVDDSAVVRQTLTAVLESDPEIEVAGTAGDGVLQANAVFIGAHAVRGDARRAGKRRRSEQTTAEARAFFVGPIDHPHGDRRASVEFSREPSQHFETCGDADGVTRKRLDPGRAAAHPAITSTMPSRVRTG